MLEPNKLELAGIMTVLESPNSLEMLGVDGTDLVEDTDVALFIADDTIGSRESQALSVLIEGPNGLMIAFIGVLEELLGEFNEAPNEFSGVFVGAPKGLVVVVFILIFSFFISFPAKGDLTVPGAPNILDTDALATVPESLTHFTCRISSSMHFCPN